MALSVICSSKGNVLSESNILVVSCVVLNGLASFVIVEGLHDGSKARDVNLGGWLVIEGWMIKPSLFGGTANGDMLVSYLLFIFSLFFFPFKYMIFGVLITYLADLCMLVRIEKRSIGRHRFNLSQGRCRSMCLLRMGEK